MKKLNTLQLLMGLLFSLQLSAQNFNDLNFGTDYSLDVVTWNTEWFPTNGSTTVNYVKEIVEALDAEIIAFQEIDNKTQFQNLINSLDDYDGYYISNDDYQGLAYLYHKDRIQIQDQYEIYQNDWNVFPRSPLVMEFSFDGENYVIIDNHLKCCGDGILDMGNNSDEEYRRYMACNMLNNYIEDNFNDKKLILLGDLNDEITDNSSNNVFSVFINDSQHYLFTDMEIAEGTSNNWSYPTWPSHLDHILITNELFSTYNEDASTCEVIRLDDYFPSWNQYESNVSDHRPVGIKLQTSEIGIDEMGARMTQISPNPVGDFIQIPANIDYHMFKILNSSGKTIFESTTKISAVSTENWTSGLYYIQFVFDGNQTFTQKLLKL